MSVQKEEHKEGKEPTSSATQQQRSLLEVLSFSDLFAYFEVWLIALAN